MKKVSNVAFCHGKKHFLLYFIVFLLYIVIFLYLFEKKVFYGIIELSSEIDSNYKATMKG